MFKQILRGKDSRSSLSETRTKEWLLKNKKQNNSKACISCSNDIGVTDRDMDDGDEIVEQESDDFETKALMDKQISKCACSQSHIVIE